MERRNRMKPIIILALVVILCSTFCLAQTPNLEPTNFLTLKNANVLQSWDTAHENQSVTGQPLHIADINYNYGIGTHANSEITIPLKRKYETFKVIIGIDDDIKLNSNKEKASVIFKISLDGKEIFTSNIKKFGTPPETVMVSVNGGKKMKLIVNDAGDGADCDHADWAMAELVPSSTPPHNYLIIP